MTNEMGITPAARDHVQAFMEQRRSEKAREFGAKEEAAESSPDASIEESVLPEEGQGETEESRIPYSRLKQVLDENKELKNQKADVGRMKKELAAYRKKEEKYKQSDLAAEFASSDNLPEEYELWEEPRQQAHMAAVAATHRDDEIQGLEDKLNRLTTQVNLSRHFGEDLTDEQFNSITAIGEDTDWTLSPDECAAIAVQRNPSLFETGGSNSELPPSHQTPNSLGSRRAKPTVQARSKQSAMKRVMAAGSTQERMRAAGEYLKVARRSNP